MGSDQEGDGRRRGDCSLPLLSFPPEVPVTYWKLGDEDNDVDHIFVRRHCQREIELERKHSSSASRIVRQSSLHVKK